MTPPRNCRKTLVGASIARPCPFALQENRPGKCVAAVSGRATNGRPYTRNKAGMQFFDGLRSGQDRSLQISRQRCGGYNKVGGNKKSHHGRWWENALSKNYRTILLSLRNSSIANRASFLLGILNLINSNFLVILNSLISTVAVCAGVARIAIDNSIHRSIIIIENLVIAAHFRKVNQFLTILCNLCFNSLASSRGTISSHFAISFRAFGLSCHDNHTGLRNNLLLVGLVNIASQRRNQQRGQDGQDDQNDDQLDEGEALFVFQFFEHLVFLQFCLCADTSRPHRHFISSFYNTVCVLSSQNVL